MFVLISSISTFWLGAIISLFTHSWWPFLAGTIAVGLVAKYEKEIKKFLKISKED